MSRFLDPCFTPRPPGLLPRLGYRQQVHSKRWCVGVSVEHWVRALREYSQENIVGFMR